MDSALKCLVLASCQLGHYTTVEQIKSEHNISEPEVTYTALIDIAASLHLSARALALNWQGLNKSKAKKTLPLIARLKNGVSILVTDVRSCNGEDQVQILDPLSFRVRANWVSRERFEQLYTGQTLIIKPDSNDSQIPEKKRCWLGRILPFCGTQGK